MLAVAAGQFANPFVGQIQFAAGATSGPTTVSASYATITDMTKTLTTQGGKLKATLTIQYSHSTTTALTTFAFSLDGAAEVAPYVSQQGATANLTMTITIVHLFTGVAAGSHTIAARWKTDNATATATSTFRELSVEEWPA